MTSADLDGEFSPSSTSSPMPSPFIADFAAMTVSIKPASRSASTRRFASHCRLCMMSAGVIFGYFAARSKACFRSPRSRLAEFRRRSCATSSWSEAPASIAFFVSWITAEPRRPSTKGPTFFQAEATAPCIPPMVRENIESLAFATSAARPTADRPASSVARRRSLRHAGDHSLRSEGARQRNCSRGAIEPGGGFRGGRGITGERGPHWASSIFANDDRACVENCTVQQISPSIRNTQSQKSQLAPESTVVEQARELWQEGSCEPRANFCDYVPLLWSMMPPSDQSVAVQIGAIRRDRPGRESTEAEFGGSR